MIRNSGRRRTLAALAVLGLGGGLLAFANPAGATVVTPPDGGAVTQGTASSTGQSPVNIECAWALPDMDREWSNGMTYSTNPADDKPSVLADKPCQARDGVVQMANSSVPQIQVAPNVNDTSPTGKTGNNGLRWVELWVAADHPAGPSHINNVIFDVYHPDGTTKVNIVGSRNISCTEPAAMWPQAGANNIFGYGAANDESSGMKNECLEGYKGFYYGAFGLSKHQPYGIYTVRVTVSPDFGPAAVKEFKIEVLPVAALDIDFNKVDYTPLASNQPSFVPGDFIWDANPAKVTAKYRVPGGTVESRGNAGIGVAVAFDRMCYQLGIDTNCSDQQVKRIDQFDAGFAADPHLARINPPPITTGPFVVPYQVDYQASESGATPAAQVNLWNSDNPNHFLCPNDLGKLDLSAHPESLISGGVYTGAMYVYAKARPLCVTDQGSEYVANGYNGVTPYASGYHAV
jgi:hypothetical protein